MCRWFCLEEVTGVDLAAATQHFFTLLCVVGGLQKKAREKLVEKERKRL